MKANRAQIERALRNPDGLRFLLLHGPDQAASRALTKIMADAMGPEAERVEIAGSDLKADPPRLAAEAASLSLFGSARYIVVDAEGEEVTAAIETLAAADAAGNPVIVLAGILRSSSRLLKFTLSEPAALAFASYVPEGREADRLVVDVGRQMGLSAKADAAQRIAEATGGNRAIIEQELTKYALFLDAAPDRPKALDTDVVDLLGTDSGEGDLTRLVDSVGNGDAVMLQEELLRLSSQGVEGISLVRAVIRRMALLARLRAEVDRGIGVESVMASQSNSLFWKEKPAITNQLARWRSPLIAKAMARLLDAELQVKKSGGIGALAIDEELLAICRQAGRLSG